MTVHFIGAGPGAADLITVRGRDLIGRCPVCLYAGSIVPKELLAYCPSGARIVDTAPTVARRDRGGIRLGSREGSRHRAAAFRRSLHLQRAGRAAPASRTARYSLHRDAGRAGVRRGCRCARPRTDGAGVDAERGADPDARPRLRDAQGRDASRLSPPPARPWSFIWRSSRWPPSWPSCPRSTARIVRSRLLFARAGQTSGSFARHTRHDHARRLAAEPIDRTALVMVGRALAAHDFRESALYDPDYRRRFRGEQP